MLIKLVNVCPTNRLNENFYGELILNLWFKNKLLCLAHDWNDVMLENKKNNSFKIKMVPYNVRITRRIHVAVLPY